MIDESTQYRLATMLPLLTENQRRKYLAMEAKSRGRGGISEISRFTGASRATISAGMKEIEGLSSDPTAKTAGEGGVRIRKSGGGRKSITEHTPEVLQALESLVDDSTLGNPQSPLKWTTKSLRNLQGELQKQGYRISHVKVGQLLEQLGYRLQMNKKSLQVGTFHIDRDAQFQCISAMSSEFLAQGQPVISVDAKKKEFIGNFKNPRVDYRKKGEALEVLDHDFPLPEHGKAILYGISDVGKNEGYVSVGVRSDTARFAARSIRSWWDEMGCQKYRGATRLYIIADGGISNGSRNRA